MKNTITGGGIRSILYTIKVALRVGVFSFLKTVFSKNTCKTCAYGMGGQQGGMTNEKAGFPEICKKSIQAQLTDIQKAIPEAIFKKNQISEFARMHGKDLERLGRLNFPLFRKSGSDFYETVSWDKALNEIINKFRTTKSEKTFFYSSGRSSNEAAFLMHLFARCYGTNNVNNCSYYCHQASGVGLSETLGTSTATIQLEDIGKADTIFVIGANAASNHPRFLTELIQCRKRGGSVIIINPLKEPGLVRFTLPQNLSSLFEGGSEVASIYLQVKIGGDIALLKGIAKWLIEKNLLDKEFIQCHTVGWKSFDDEITHTSWDEIIHSSGISKTDIEKTATVYSLSKNTIFAWAMGVTHHVHGVENVRAIVNLALVRGMIGKQGAGLLPLRGHSNVQGIGTMGVTPELKTNVFNNIEQYFNIALPKEPGWDTLTAVEKAHQGEVELAFLLGGNLFGANPDSTYSTKAFSNIGMTIYLSTTLNKGHFLGAGMESIILPVMARDEEKQSTTQESMFSFVRLSDGGIVRLNNVRAETEIISDIAESVLPEHPVSFKKFKDHISLRDAIAGIIPGMEKLAEIDKTKNEFTIEGRIVHAPVFNTPDKKAKFSVTLLPVQKSENGSYLLMSIRSEGQFNTVIYEEEDVYRGQEHRWVVLMNKNDMDREQIRENQKITLYNETGKMVNVLAKEFSIPCGNLAVYYPEGNVLIPRIRDVKSRTPAFKSVEVWVGIG